MKKINAIPYLFEGSARVILYLVPLLLPLFLTNAEYALVYIFIISENILEVVFQFGFAELLVAERKIAIAINIVYNNLFGGLWLFVLAAIGILSPIASWLVSNKINLALYSSNIILLVTISIIYNKNFIRLSLVKCWSLERYSFLKFLTSLFRVICIFLFIYLHGIMGQAVNSVWPKPSIYLLSLMVSESLIWISLYRESIKKQMYAKKNKKEFRKSTNANLSIIFKKSKYFYQSSIISILSVYVLRLIMPFFIQDKNELALFYFSSTLATACYFGIGIIHNLMTPRIYASTGEIKFRKLVELLKRTFAVCLVIDLILIVIMRINDGYILSFAAKYSSMKLTLILMAACFGSLIIDWAKVVFIADFKYKTLFIVEISSLISPLILLPLAVAHGGLYGFAYVTALSPFMVLLIIITLLINSMKSLVKNASYLGF
jgi:hypothetical protein